MADDLTGALDSSCMFPPKGFKTRVYSDLPENTDRLKKDIAINTILAADTAEPTNNDIGSNENKKKKYLYIKS